jgi:hypothetical protein
LFFPRRDLNPHHCYTAAPFYIKKPDEIRMLVHIKEIIKKKKNKTDFSQHSCSLIFIRIYIYIYIDCQNIMKYVKW